MKTEFPAMYGLMNVEALPPPTANAGSGAQAAGSGKHLTGFVELLRERLTDRSSTTQPIERKAENPVASRPTDGLQTVTPTARPLPASGVPQLPVGVALYPDPGAPGSEVKSIGDALSRNSAEPSSSRQAGKYLPVLRLSGQLSAAGSGQLSLRSVEIETPINSEDPKQKQIVASDVTGEMERRTRLSGGGSALGSRPDGGNAPGEDPTIGLERALSALLASARAEMAQTNSRAESRIERAQENGQIAPSDVTQAVSLEALTRNRADHFALSAEGGPLRPITSPGEPLLSASLPPADLLNSSGAEQLPNGLVRETESIQPDATRFVQSPPAGTNDFLGVGQASQAASTVIQTGPTQAHDQPAEDAQARISPLDAWNPTGQSVQPIAQISTGGGTNRLDHPRIAGISEAANFDNELVIDGHSPGAGARGPRLEESHVYAAVGNSAQGQVLSTTAHALTPQNGDVITPIGADAFLYANTIDTVGIHGQPERTEITVSSVAVNGLTSAGGAQWGRDGNLQLPLGGNASSQRSASESTRGSVPRPGSDTVVLNNGGEAPAFKAPGFALPESQIGAREPGQPSDPEPSKVALHRIQPQSVQPGSPVTDRSGHTQTVARGDAAFGPSALQSDAALITAKERVSTDGSFETPLRSEGNPSRTHGHEPTLPSALPQSARAAVDTVGPAINTAMLSASPPIAHAVHERILWASANHMSRAEIQLDPPELGLLHIQINSHRDATGIQIHAQNPQIKELIEQSLPRLRDMLEHSGLQQVSVDVSGNPYGDSRDPTSMLQGRNQHLAGNPAESGPELLSQSIDIPRALGLIDYYA